MPLQRVDPKPTTASVKYDILFSDVKDRHRRTGVQSLDYGKARKALDLPGKKRTENTPNEEETAFPLALTGKNK